jgi:hypothetical protein
MTCRNASSALILSSRSSILKLGNQGTICRRIADLPGGIDTIDMTDFGFSGPPDVNARTSFVEFNGNLRMFVDGDFHGLVQNYSFNASDFAF